MEGAASIGEPAGSGAGGLSASASNQDPNESRARSSAVVEAEPTSVAEESLRISEAMRAQLEQQFLE